MKQWENEEQMYNSYWLPILALKTQKSVAEKHIYNSMRITVPHRWTNVLSSGKKRKKMKIIHLGLAELLSSVISFRLQQRKFSV